MSNNRSENSNIPSLYPNLNSPVNSSFTSPPHTPIQKMSFAMRVLLFSCISILLLAACGPETPSVDHDVMRDEAVRIAQEYGAAPDVEKARTELAELDISNINQWLKYVAEDEITQNTDPNATNALVRLALDLGVRSVTIDRFGIDAGMLEAPASAEVLAPSASVLEQSSASVIDAFNSDDKAEESTQRIELVPINAAEESAESPVTDAPVAETVAEEVVDVAADEPSTEQAPAEVVEPQAPIDPIAIANDGMNVRSGPGITYGIAGALQTGEKATVIAKNPAGDWWQVKLATGATGWLYAPLTTIEGSTTAVAIASNIPAPPPPTAVPPPPTAYPTPTFTYAPPVAAPVVAAPATPVPAPVAPQPPAPEPEPEKPVASGNTFKLVERRLWGVEENGGFLAGDSVNCGDKRELRVRVIDAAGNPLNGVTVHGVYTKVDVSTGSQGKGDGVAEYVLGDGEDIKIIRDTDGSDVTSDAATGMVTKPGLIDTGSLIQAGYCQDEASCQKNVVQPYACGGHYSWDVKFQRSY